MHPMERLAYRRLWAAVTQVNESEGLMETSFVDKGSLIQLVADRLVEEDRSLLFKGRWYPVERKPENAATWMIRDGWFQRPLIVLWRLSLALSYLWLGIRYAFRALLGETVD